MQLFYEKNSHILRENGGLLKRRRPGRVRQQTHTFCVLKGSDIESKRSDLYFLFDNIYKAERFKTLNNYFFTRLHEDFCFYTHNHI